MKKVLFWALATLAAASYAEPYVWGNVRFEGGGFVSAVLPHPAVENLVYARTDVGGVYRWNATTSRWIPLMDFLSENDKGLYGAESFAIDPQNPAKLYVLAGTGYNSNGLTAIFRSDDYGDTFDTTHVEFLAHGNGMGRQTGEKLAVDPNMPNVLFCGSRTKGLYKSTDYGKTWSNAYKVALSSATGNSLNNVNGISFVVFDASQGKLSDGRTAVIYMGISATADNLYVSKDGGATWALISGGPSSLMPNRMKIADGKLFLTYSNSEGPMNVSQGAIYTYNVASATWANITPYQDGSTTDRMGNGGQGASNGFGGISIDPNDAKHIIATTLCYYGGRHLYADSTNGWGDRIYVTTDGGATWKHGQGYNAGVNIDANGNAWIHGNAIHWAGSIEFDPFDTKKAWVTSGNGVFQTDDISAAVPLWKFQSKGIEETVPLDIVSVPGGPLVTAIGDYDGAAYTNINVSTPRHNPMIGTTQSLGYAPLVNAFLRAGYVTDYSTGTGISSNAMYFSDDGASTWTKVPTVMGTLGLVVLSGDGKVFLHRFENGTDVYRSEDGGKTWGTATGLDGQASGARIVCDPVNPDVFYVLDMQGNLKRSTDKGATFETYGSIKDESNSLYYNGGGLIRTVPGREGHLWAPLDQSQTWLAKGYSENGLASSEDGGKTWTRYSNVSTAIAVGIGKAKDGADYETIYIWGIAGGSSNTLGIYRSTDKGTTWERINDDKHQFGGPGNGNFVAGDMNTFGVVYMSTVGRGLVVGAPESSNFLGIQKVVQPTYSLSLRVVSRNLFVNAPENSRLILVNSKGRTVLISQIGSNSNVSLKGLPAGNLFARVISKSGKVLLNRNISIR